MGAGNRSIKKDLSFLQRPEIFHPLSQIDIPPPFRAPAPAAPDANKDTATLHTLLRKGHYQRAAILAAQQLTRLPSSVSSTSPTQILTLFYIRLACLTLLQQTALAAQESKALEDLSSPFYRDGGPGGGGTTPPHLAPWELRVLAVRLQAIGWADWRRGVEGYYELARECRAEWARERARARANKVGARRQARRWRRRLAEVGQLVCHALVDMGDVPAAARFLEAQRRARRGGAANFDARPNDEDEDEDGDDDDDDDGDKGDARDEGDDMGLGAQLALLYLRMGNVQAAANAVAEVEGPASSVVQEGGTE
ncbi:MAG: hypothetical protein M1826_004807 [Phylliscum demangeonii]|nr:MAG: hypothetical protein M1826_004807 [Phylliscum demangeonii]